jgi:hypothetical protein
MEMSERNWGAGVCYVRDSNGVQQTRKRQKSLNLADSGVSVLPDESCTLRRLIELILDGTRKGRRVEVAVVKQRDVSILQDSDGMLMRKWNRVVDKTEFIVRTSHQHGGSRKHKPIHPTFLWAAPSDSNRTLPHANSCSICSRVFPFVSGNFLRMYKKPAPQIPP